MRGPSFDRHGKGPAPPPGGAFPFFARSSRWEANELAGLTKTTKGRLRIQERGIER
jgi:hypothetical protein